MKACSEPQRNELAPTIHFAKADPSRRASTRLRSINTDIPSLFTSSSRINDNITVRPYPQSCIWLSKTRTECHTPFQACLMVHHHPYGITGGLILPVTHYSIPHGYDPRAERRLRETCSRTVYIRRLANNQQSPSEACCFCAVASLGSERR